MTEGGKIEERKFCVNCRHHYHNSGASPSIPAGHRCTHSELTGWDLVTGERTFPLCRDMRASDAWCGPEGKDYDPKIPVMRPYAPKEKKDGGSCEAAARSS
jgi:hypothetical protein